MLSSKCGVEETYDEHLLIFLKYKFQKTKTGILPVFSKHPVNDTLQESGMKEAKY